MDKQNKNAVALYILGASDALPGGLDHSAAAAAKATKRLHQTLQGNPGGDELSQCLKDRSSSAAAYKMNNGKAWPF